MRTKGKHFDFIFKENVIPIVYYCPFQKMSVVLLVRLHGNGCLVNKKLS